MKLYYKNNRERRLIGNYKKAEGAMKAISRFCKNRNYKIPYTRCWVKERVAYFVVGSHTEFFELEPVFGCIECGKFHNYNFFDDVCECGAGLK